MNLGKAIELLKQGKKVARSNWNGKDMFLFLVKGSVDMKTVDGSIVPWLCSQTDLLAEDWIEVH